MTRHTFGGYRLFWGDLHRQTGATCGEGTIRENFEVCRDELGMDFCAITDNAHIAEDPADRLLPGPHLMAHRHFYGGKAAHSVPPGYWEELRAEVARAHRPGAFVPFLAYEWCSVRWGDRNVYYADEAGPLHLPGDVFSLLDGAHSHNAMVMPHHVGYAVGRRGTDWGVHDPRVERLAEIHSTQHGCSELDAGNRYPLWSHSMGSNAPGNSLTSALLRGIRVGFVAGSDAHRLRQRPGLTGLWARDCTREALWEALWARRTVADTGARVSLGFTVESMEQGSCVVTDRLPVLALEVRAGRRIQSLEVIRQGTVVRTWHPVDLEWSTQFVDQDVPAAPHTWYYVRVTLEGGDMAWSSPVWVSYLPEAPFARDRLYWMPRPAVQWAALPDDGGWRYRIRNLGSGPDDDLIVWDLGTGDRIENEKLPFRLAAGGRVDLLVHRVPGAPLWLTVQEKSGERWTLQRHQAIG